MKQISGLIFGLLALPIVGTPAAQTTYSEKPIRMVQESRCPCLSRVLS